MNVNRSIGSEEENLVNDQTNHQSKIQTCLPGIIKSYNSTNMTCTVLPTIQATRYKTDETQENLDYPILLDCPVQFPSGGNCTITFPIKVGDECLIVFSSRSIDNWWYYGKVMPLTSVRMHDLSDGFVIVGVKSVPNVIPNISNSAVEIRNISGSSKISLAESGDVSIITGTLTVTGNTVFNGQVTANGHRIDESHTHSGVQSGGSNTGVVV